MPLYEYVCANGHRHEVMHGVHDTGPTVCPTCGAPMRKAFVAPAIVFKGSGWAKVDRRSSTSTTSKSSSGSSASDAASGSSSSGSTSTDGGTSSAAKSDGPTSATKKADSTD